MTEHESLHISYTPRPDRERRRPSLRLTLEPERVEARRNRATLADVDAMLALAMSGASARMRQIARCRWAQWAENGDLLCTLSCWVWPSRLDLHYTLGLPPGVTSAAPVRVSEPRDTKIWVDGDTEIELPWLLEPGQYGWHPAVGCRDAWSRPTAPPRIRARHADLLLDTEEDVYGVLTATGTAQGWRHDITIRYPTGQNRDQDPETPAISISGADDIEVTATWTDETGEDQVEEAVLQIPDCVKSLLEQCPEGSKRGGSVIIQYDDPVGPPVIYYNGCTGTVLGRGRGT